MPNRIKNVIFTKLNEKSSRNTQGYFSMSHRNRSRIKVESFNSSLFPQKKINWNYTLITLYARLKKKIDLIKNITLLNLTKRELLNLKGTKITKRKLLNLTKREGGKEILQWTLLYQSNRQYFFVIRVSF